MDVILIVLMIFLNVLVFTFSKKKHSLQAYLRLEEPRKDRALLDPPQMLNIIFFKNKIGRSWLQ